MCRILFTLGRLILKNTQPVFYMSRLLKILLIILISIVSLWILGRITNTFQYYNTPTPANEPTIKAGNKFFASVLKTPRRFDFICFNGEVPGLGMQLRVFRLCGMSGDTVEIRNGVLFINDEAVDKKLTLSHNYLVPAPEYEKIKDKLNGTESFFTQNASDKVTVTLTEKFVSGNHLNATRIVLPKSYADTEISKLFLHPWNQDNFGPVKVPVNHYFVLGDNRHNALDSRYTGFINKKDFVATVLWKK